MNEDKIIKFLSENMESVNKELLSASKASIIIGGSGWDTCDMRVSVVLTTDFEIESYSHLRSYSHTTDVLLVLATFDQEYYAPEYKEITHHMIDEEVKKYNQFMITEGLKLLESETDDDIIDEFETLSENQMFDFIVSYISDQGLLLDLLNDLNPVLHNEVKKKIFEDVFDEEIPDVFESVYRSAAI